MVAVHGLQFRITVQWTLDAISSWKTPDLPTSLRLGGLWRTITVRPPVCSQSHFHLSAKCISIWPLTNNSRFLFLVLFLFFNSSLLHFRVPWERGQTCANSLLGASMIQFLIQNYEIPKLWKWNISQNRCRITWQPNNKAICTFIYPI